MKRLKNDVNFSETKKVWTIELFLIFMLSGIRGAASVTFWLLLIGTVSVAADLPQPTTAYFTDGNGTTLPDQYPGIAGGGWSGGWQSAGVTATVIAANPVNNGGNYLSVTAIEGGDGTGRAFSSFGSNNSSIDTGSPYDMTFDYRIDVMPDIGQLSNINGRLQIFGSHVMSPNTDSNISFFIFASSGLTGSGAGTTPVWQFYNGRKNGVWNTSYVVNSGMKVYAGHVYRFSIGMEPGSLEYSVSIDDMNDTAGSVYVAGLGFRRSTLITQPYTVFSAQAGTTGTGQISIDNFKVVRRPAGATQITVDGNSPIRTIPMTMYGGNITCWDGSQSGYNTTYNNLMIASGRKYQRWPGGSWGDCFLWRDMEGPNSANTWIVSHNETMNVLFPAISQPGEEMPPTLQPIVNFPGWWYGAQHTHEEAVAEAVAWVQDQTSRPNTAQYWEIGNEIGGSWECGWFSGLNGTYYGDYFADFYLAMKAVNPNIKIGFHGNESGVPGWTYDTLMAARLKGVVPDFIIIHTYPAGGSSDNQALLTGAVNYLTTYTSELNNSVSAALGASYVGQIGYFMTEWDCGGSNYYNRNSSYVNAMFHAQYILEMARLKWIGSNAWTQSEYGSNFFVYPVWYIHPILINFFGRDMVAAASSNPLVRVYAAKDAKGNMTVFIFNNSPVDTVPAQINISGFAAAASGQQWLIEPAGNRVTGGINNQDMDNISINGIIHPDPQMVKTLVPRSIPYGNPLTLELVPSAMVLLKIPASNGDITPPAAPAGFTAASRSLSVVLDWNNNTETDFKGYIVYRSETSGSGYTRLNAELLTSSTYTDTNVAEDTTYCYIVTAVDTSLNQSAVSAEQTVAFPKTDVGFILRQYWTGIAGASVSNLTSDPNYPNNPNGSEMLRTLEGPANWRDSYGTRFRGYLHPLTTGSYTFWIAADDTAELWLSTNGNPANRVRIAAVGAYTAARQWNKYSSQQSAAKTLTAGQKYYIEVLHKESAGGDHVAVAWSGPGITQQVIDGIYLSPWLTGLYGDFNKDGAVNIIDFYDFAALWLRSDCFSTAGTDMDGNCLIDFIDFSQMTNNWLKP